MNPFDSETINIDGVIVKLPDIQDGSSDLSPSITFKPTKWMKDTESVACTNCQLKFTQLRRKHHCRNCGKIYCSKCCNEKMFLPHFGINQMERVCASCKLIVDLLIKAKSDDVNLWQEAVVGLTNLATNNAGLCKVIENGGIHIMFALSLHGDIILKFAVASAIHKIAQNVMLHLFLVETGCLKVLKNAISSADSDQYDLLSDTLMTLQHLCHDNRVKVQVLKEGMVEILLKVVNYSGIPALLSARVLLMLVNNYDHHEYILQKHSSIVSSLLNAQRKDDFQLQTTLSKVLVYLTAGSESFRQLVIKEDAEQNFPLLCLLKSPHIAALVNAVCIIANVSLSMKENPAERYISTLCELLDVRDGVSSDVMTHIARGLANFADHSVNTLQLIHHLQSIVSNLLKSDEEVHKIHACRLIIKLFSENSSFTLEVLSQNGLLEFLKMILGLPGLSDTISSLLLRKVSRLSVTQ